MREPTASASMRCRPAATTSDVIEVISPPGTGRRFAASTVPAWRLHSARCNRRKQTQTGSDSVATVLQLFGVLAPLLCQPTSSPRARLRLDQAEGTQLG